MEGRPGGMITTSGSIVAIRLSRSSAFTPAKNSSPSFLIAFTSSAVVAFVSMSPPSAGNIKETLQLGRITLAPTPYLHCQVVKYSDYTSNPANRLCENHSLSAWSFDINPGWQRPGAMKPNLTRVVFGGIAAGVVNHTSSAQCAILWVTHRRRQQNR